MMTDEKKFTGWKRTYIGLLNAATVICIMLGILIHFGGWIGGGAFKFLTNFGTRNAQTSSSDVIGGSVDRMDAFTKVEGDISAGSVTFVTGDSYGCSYENYPQDELPDIAINGNTLKIKQKSRNNWKFGEIKNSYSDAKIVITLPKEAATDVDLDLSLGALEAKDVTFGDLDLDAALGSIELEDCMIKDLDLNADTGSISVKDSTFDEGDIKAAMGGIELVNVGFDEGQVKADMGGITVDGSFNKLEAKCSMGGIDVTTKNDDAKLSLSADMGGITVNGESVGRNYKN